MNKKIRKYIKSFILIFVVISMIFNSHASTGVGDPNAFVTKEEFDLALSNFNSRLSEFEAGINSKIDSQVTSYLTRNGIWSGLDQTTESSGVYKWPMYQVFNGTKSTCTWKGSSYNQTTYAACKTAAASWTTGGEPCLGFRDTYPSAKSFMFWFNATSDKNYTTPTYGFIHPKLFFTSTKSGLAVCHIKQTEVDWRIWKIQLQKPVTSAGWVQDNRGAMDLGYSVVVNAFKSDGVSLNPDADIKNRTSFASRAWTEAEYSKAAPLTAYGYFGNETNGYNILDLGIQNINKYEYFFVEKGDKVYLTMAPIFPSLAHDERLVTFATSYVVDDLTPVKLECDSAIVY